MKLLSTFLFLICINLLTAQNFTKLMTFDKIDFGTSGYYVAASFNNKIVFLLGNASDPHLLYISDGTVAGTKEIAALTQFDYFVNFVNEDPFYLYFVKEISGADDQLVRMNKSTLSFENLGNGPGFKFLKFMNSKLYYMSGSDLKEMDPNTKAVKNVKSSLAQGDPIIFTAFKNKLTIIHRNTTNKVVMTVSDGTIAGTSEVKDFGIEVAANFRAEGPWIHNNKLFFTIRARYNGVFDKSMWASDGTDAGTVKIKSIDIQNSGFFYETKGIDGGNNFYFTSTDPGSTVMQLFRTDGTLAGTEKLADDKLKFPESFVNYKGKTYFLAPDLGNIGNIFSVVNDDVEEIYNFTDEGVSLYTPFTFNDSLFFIGVNNEYGSEFWKSDGSASGLSVLPQGNKAIGASIFTATATEKYIFYTKRINGEEKELWVYDPKVYVASIKVEVEIFSISPNPAKDQLFLPKNIQNGILEITDISGRTISSHEFKGNEIDISKIPSGMYSIKISAKNKYFISKFIKL